MKRFYQIALTALSMGFFLAISSENIQGAQLELIGLAILCIPFLALSIFLKPVFSFTEKQNFLVAFPLFALAITKHLLTRYTSNVASFASFAIVPFIFCMGEVFILLSIWELYQKNSTKFRTLFYNGMVLITASYSYQTTLLLYFFIFFIFLCILYARYEFPPNDKRQKILYQIQKISILFLVLLICLSPAIFIAKNRDHLVGLHPLRLSSSINFSSFSFLTSKNLKVSQDMVFQYYASPGVYYLRGKVFDSYNKGQWTLSFQDVKKLKGIKKTYRYPYQYNLYPDIEENRLATHRLVFVVNPYEYLFLPSSCGSISLAKRTNVYKNQEQIVWGELPKSNHIHIYKLPLQTLTHNEAKRYLQIPSENRSYFVQKAKEIVEKISDPLAQARKLTSYLKENHPYRLEIKIEDDQDAIVYFLEKKVGGHCEMFSSAFVMLARALDIPTRYVTGYCAQEWNEMQKCLAVRNCDAHAWAEIYIPEKGWLTIDATSTSAWQEEIKKHQNPLLVLWEQIYQLWEEVKQKGQKISLKNLLLYFALLLGLCLSFWILFRSRKKIFYFFKEKRTAPIHASNPQLQALVKKFLDFQKSSSIRKKKSQETLRQYLTSNAIPKEIQSFAYEFLLLLEKNLYSGKKLEPSEIEELGKKCPL